MAGERRAMVERRRLLDRLGDRYRTRLTIVEAGAGFGKTTLVRQAIDESESLDRGLDIVVQAGIGVGVIDALAAGLDAVGDEIDAIVDAMLVRSPEDVVLWIDDTHRLDDDEVRSVDRLVDELPTNGHLVLVGRRMPRLGIARLELDGLVLRLGERDLRFDADEQNAFAHLRAVALPDRADGWPALMELEASAGRTGAIDYLTDEVIDDLDAGRRSALLRLAHLDWFDETMVHAVSDFAGSLDDLIAGLPLARLTVRSDAAGHEIRVAVLHDLLRDALAEIAGDGLRDAVGATAEEMLRRGELSAAAQRFARIGDRPGLARVAQRLIDDLHAAAAIGDRQTVVELVSESLGDDPLALMLRGVYLAIADPVAAPPVLDAAVEAARSVGRDDLEAVGCYRLAEVSYLRGDVDGTVRHGALLGAMAEAGQPIARRLAFLPRLWQMRMTERMDEAIEMLDELLTDDGLSGDPEMESLARFYRTVTLAYSGRLRDALHEVERYAAALPPGLFADRLGGFVTIQRWMLGEQSSDVRATAERLIDRIEARGQMHLFVEGAATCAIFAASAGDLDAARVLVARATAAAPALAEAAWSNHTLAQAEAVIDLFDRGEAAAAARLEAAIPPGGPSDGLSSHVYNLTAGLSYVLVPRVREHWERSSVEPDVTARTAAPRALVAFRERGDTAPAAALNWLEVHRIKPWMFEPHLVELAVAAIAGGNDAAAVAFTDLSDDNLRVLEPLTGAVAPVAKVANRLIKTTPRRPDGTLQIKVLGALSIDRGGRDETDLPIWRRARVKDLLMVLVHERKVSRRRLGELLWPDKGTDAAQNNLRVNLSHLVGALDPDRDPASPSWVIRSEGESVRLHDVGFVAIDVDRFRTERSDARVVDESSPREALRHHLAAVDTFGGEYLDGCELVDSMYYERLHLRGEFVASAIRAADLLLAMGDADEAERIVRRASTTEPLNEPAQRALAAALLAQRRVGAAIDVLSGLLMRLGELSIPPEPATRRLAERLRIGAPRH